MVLNHIRHKYKTLGIQCIDCEFSCKLPAGRPLCGKLSLLVLGPVLSRPRIGGRLSIGLSFVAGLTKKKIITAVHPTKPAPACARVCMRQLPEKSESDCTRM